MNYKRLQIYFFLGLLLIAGAATLFIFFPYLTPILLGATFAIIFYPVYTRILVALGNRETLAAVLTTLLVLILVFVPLVYFSMRLFDEARQLYVSLALGGDQSIFAKAVVFFENISKQLGAPQPKLSPEEFSRSIAGYTQQAAGWLLQRLGLIFSSVAKITFNLFLSLLAFYYFLRDGHRLKQMIISASPLADRYDKEIFDKLSVVINSVIKGALVVAVLQGLLSGVGFFIFGVPHAVIWGMFAVIAALVPSFGTALITFPAAIYLFIAGNTTGAIGMALWAFLLVGLIDNFLSPKLIQRGTHIHPFVILLSVLGGISVFGPIGFVMGPLIISFFFALLHIYTQEFKEYLADVH